MQGFVYLWYDKARKMFYVGSHTGDPTDGYLSSSRWLNGEIRYRPNDFKRRILIQSSTSNILSEEYRLLGMIKSHEFGSKYYNIKSGQKQGYVPWNKGKTKIYTDETLKKMSDAKIGKSTTKGRSNPLAAQNARKGAEKLSKKTTGRKLQTRPDGSRYWVYPEAS